MFAGLDVKVLFHIRQAYQLNVEDTEQPLLIHRPKKKTGGDLRKVILCTIKYCRVSIIF